LNNIRTIVEKKGEKQQKTLASLAPLRLRGEISSADSRQPATGTRNPETKNAIS
jgi:hypothetical protein